MLYSNGVAEPQQNWTDVGDEQLQKGTDLMLAHSIPENVRHDGASLLGKVKLASPPTKPSSTTENPPTEPLPVAPLEQDFVSCPLVVQPNPYRLDKAVTQHTNLVHLESLIGYFLQRNHFFGCLQIEAIAYLVAAFTFVIQLRKEAQDASISTSLVPWCMLYLCYGIKAVRKLRVSWTEMQKKQVTAQLVAICFYIAFIVVPPDLDRRLRG